jgi:hypothetical protein
MATSAFGAYKSAAGQKAALGYQAGVATSNAKPQRGAGALRAAQWRAAGAGLRLKDGRAGGRPEGRGRSQRRGCGLGSPVEMIASSKFLGENDALTIRDNAARQRLGLPRAGARLPQREGDGPNRPPAA